MRDGGFHALLHFTEFTQAILQLISVNFVWVEIQSALFSLQHFLFIDNIDYELLYCLAMPYFLLIWHALIIILSRQNDQQQPNKRRAEPNKQPSGSDRNPPDVKLVQRSLYSIDINRYSGLLSKVFTPEIRSYFDVNTDLVKKKLLKLIVPFKTFEWE